MRLQLPQTVGQQDPTVETGMPLIANCKDFDAHGASITGATQQKVASHNGRATYGAGYSSGLISGIIDLQIIYGGVPDAVKRSACPPDSVTVGHVVVVKVVLQFLNDNPAKVNRSDAELVMGALHQAFPCPSAN
ncbi:MAG TPA: Rap1a/Tai family immunity protein [Candidatus Dormibacteraeota bacterium]|nr:Rap1a/Tai family immunity protein [Candidatus Dormibacteraeota bacterium]